MTGVRAGTGDRAREHVIDVWDVATFDPELVHLLSTMVVLIQDYWREHMRLFHTREVQTLRGAPQENRFGPGYQDLTEEVAALMDLCTIRAWHYTRLTKGEVDRILATGLSPMTIALVRERLDGAVAEGHLDEALAAALFDASPYHRQIGGHRENRIWMAAEPYPVDDSGVVELLAAWGGESIAFDHRSGAVREVLQSIGLPHVLEIEVPLSGSTRTLHAPGNVLDAFSFTLECVGAWGGGADIVVIEPVPPDRIVAVHAEGQETYGALGRGYPQRFRPRDG